LTGVRLALGMQPNRRPFLSASKGTVPAGWPVLEPLYRLGMVAAGAVSWPVRVLQAALGRGDELVMVAKAQ